MGRPKKTPGPDTQVWARLPTVEAKNYVVEQAERETRTQSSMAAALIMEAIAARRRQ